MKQQKMSTLRTALLALVISASFASCVVVAHPVHRRWVRAHWEVGPYGGRHWVRGHYIAV